jgi:hypothetical protein
VRLVDQERVGEYVAATLAVGPDLWRVLVRATRTQPQRLTCASERRQPTTRWECAEVVRLA